MDRRAMGAMGMMVAMVGVGCPGEEPERIGAAPAPGAPAVVIAKREVPPPALDERLRRDLHRTPRVAATPSPEKPIIILEEEVVVTQDVPRGTDLSNLANKNLDSTHVVDAYGVGGGSSGAYGQRWGGSLTRAGGASPTPPEHRFRAAVGPDQRSTFAIDVDTAAYANVRRFLRRHTLPPARAVRIEELINYFPYAYAPPEGPHPLAAQVEVADCPWAPAHRLVRIGLQGREVEPGQRPPSNLVFLVDVSGSMRTPDKLDLLKRSLELLVRQLDERDRVAIVTYAGASGLALPSTPCDDPTPILQAIQRLEAGGSTNGGAGVHLAYQTAVEHYVEGGINRVVLATDGDWNVGIRSRDALRTFIAEKARSGVFLSVLGFGIRGGDEPMEALADRGNGHYASIDGLREAQKALVDELSGTLQTIAKDVKVQVAFDPAQVASYRQVGYENRALANADFTNDAKDGGEVGAGHRVTALYEVVLHDDAQPAGRLLTVHLRYKRPAGETSIPFSQEVPDVRRPFAEASEDLRFASSVAAFGLLLRSSPHAGTASWGAVATWAEESLGPDTQGLRAEFVELVRAARALAEPARVSAEPTGKEGRRG